MKIFMKYFAVAVVLIWFAGCVPYVKSSGVINAGLDTYVVVIESDASNAGGNIKQAYAEAEAFCANQKKVMQPLSTLLTNYDMTFKLTFRALDPNDPEYTRPNLEIVPDTKVTITTQNP